MTRYCRGSPTGRRRSIIIALYHMNVATEETRKAFMAKVRAAMAQVLTECSKVRKLVWSELTTEDFAGLDPEKTIAVLPIAAIEQHGPHLAVSTDTIIGQGMVRDRDRAIAGGSVRAVPARSRRSASRTSISARPARSPTRPRPRMRVWTEIGESVARAGLRKLVIVNSHGGNVDIDAASWRANCASTARCWW